MNKKKQSIFLSASWENLIMINYEVNPEILKKYLPIHTELDLYKGKAIVSIVGFMFKNTKVFGLKWPFHTNFEEVNLRFYIKHFDGEKWNRGVAFISEIVPKPAISIIANALYNEHYSTAKMKNLLIENDENLEIEYHWKRGTNAWNYMKVVANKKLNKIPENSEEEFIFEHYKGYNQLDDKTTIEYCLEHPSWMTYKVEKFELNCNVQNLYGKEFVPFINPSHLSSVFLAKGSDVIVRKPTYISRKEL
jgi:uncharacterized protein YqjF (DUF2071 family)